MYVFFHYINVIGFTFSIYCFAIVLSRGERILPMTFLFISNAILVLTSLFYYLFTSGAIYDFPHYIRVPAPLHYLVGPSIYLFVRTLLHKENKLRRWDWLHIIPFFLHFIELIPFYLQSAESKLQLVREIQQDYTVPFLSLKEGLLPSKIHTLLKVISWCAYIFMSLKTLIRFRKLIKTNLITDYVRKFQFVNYYLITKYPGIIGFLTAIYLVKIEGSLIVFTLIANIIGISNVFILTFKFPDFLYGDKIFAETENNRENLMQIVKVQTENLNFLENSKYEANVLLDLNFSVIYFNKLAEVYFKRVYNRTLELNKSILDHLDRISAEKLKYNFSQVLAGKEVEIEEKVLLHANESFSWMALNFSPQFSRGKMIGVSIGVNLIDTKKKMEELQVKYNNTLDELAWNSSHLLRAPVANILGVLNIIEDKNLRMNEDERDYFLGNIKSEVNKLDSTIKDMVSTARKQMDT